jgi:hypothetical protein
MKGNEFRIFGPEFDATEGYLDISVEGIDEDGTIYFVDEKSNREFELSTERIQDLMEENLMLNSEEVSKHKLWERVRKIGKDRNERISDNFADQHAQEAQRALFLAAYEETRPDN